MEEEIRKQLEKLNEIANEPYHDNKAMNMLAEMGKLFLIINPRAKRIIEGKSKLN